MGQSIKEAAEKCAVLIRNAERIVLFSGAGMSTSAGIPDFRGPQGLYSRADIENPELIFDINYFRRDASLFYRFHKEFLTALKDIHPTFAHRFFSKLEEQKKLLGIVTQNIDSLHQAAGSKTVLEIHGGIWDNFCTVCREHHSQEETTTMVLSLDIATCKKCGGVIKPDVVFFGEPVKHLEACGELIRSSDLLFVLGSSLVVTPAALLPSLAGGHIVVVNKGNVSQNFLPVNRIDQFVNDDIDVFFKAVNDALGIIH